LILSIDIGGTKTRLALLGNDVGRWILSAERVVDSTKIDSFEVVVKESLTDSVTGIAIGVAGPVCNNNSKISNLNWGVDGKVLSDTLNLPVYLLNDLEAHAFGLESLDPQKMVELNNSANSPRAGVKALIAAGTGLGECILGWDGQIHSPIPSEGGHTDFAPLIPRDTDLWNFLNSKYEHISWERIVSGGEGFNNLVEFSIKQKITGFEPWADLLNANQTIASTVSMRADKGDKFAIHIMNEFVRFYGAETGNLALKSLPVAGIFIGGGVAPKIKRWLMDGKFIDSYSAKGRFSDLLKSFPIYLIEDDDLALKGAAQYYYNREKRA
jgi:glucokinase